MVCTELFFTVIIYNTSNEFYIFKVIKFLSVEDFNKSNNNQNNSKSSISSIFKGNYFKKFV